MMRSNRGGTYGSCTHLRGFADRCVTAPPTRHSMYYTKIKRGQRPLFILTSLEENLVTLRNPASQSGKHSLRDIALRSAAMALLTSTSSSRFKFCIDQSKEGAEAPSLLWCTEEDLNLHERNAHQPLKLTRLPIPPPVHTLSRYRYATAQQRDIVAILGRFVNSILTDSPVQDIRVTIGLGRQLCRRVH